MNVIGLTTSTADRKRRAAQRIVMGLAGPRVNDEERSFLREAAPAGFILFARNVEEPRQVLELNRELATLVPKDFPPLRTVDQEGGRVQRVKEPATVWPPLRWVGNVDDVAYTRQLGAAMGREVRALGFDLDFAPDADVDSNPLNPIIGDRSFGRDAARVAKHVVAYLEGLQAEGCIACAKHFPGHGDTATDSHLELPVVEKDPPDLAQVELVPFVAAVRARVGAIMSAHVVYPAWDDKLPATMSSRILDGELRQKLGYQGLVFSDDLEMKAVRGRYPLELQLRLATMAGVDVFLCCKELSLVHEAYEILVRLQETDPLFEKATIASFRRLHATRERFLLRRAAAPGLDVLGSMAHRELAMRAQLGRA